MKISVDTTVNYSLVFLLLLLSGNPLFSTGSTLGIVVLVLFVGILSVKYAKSYVDIWSLPYLIYISLFGFIFSLQHIALGYVSPMSIASIFLKITAGYLVYRKVGTHFPTCYAMVMFLLAIISLFCFGLDITGAIPDGIQVSETRQSLGLYTITPNNFRNSGMFWEPGAFSIYLTLAFLFLAGDKKFFVKRPIVAFVLLSAIISTFSTTGYIVFLVYLGTILLRPTTVKSLLFSFPVLVLVVVGSFIAFTKVEFLGAKIESQAVDAQEADGEFGNSRFQSLVFDTHYIIKHPLIGNGLHQKTRYADHPWLHDQVLGHGNGFSNFLASFGVPVFMIWAYLIVKYARTYGMTTVAIMVLMLQGEQLLNYPLFLALPLWFVYDYKYRRRNSLLQPT